MALQRHRAPRNRVPVGLVAITAKLGPLQGSDFRESRVFAAFGPRPGGLRCSESVAAAASCPQTPFKVNEAPAILSFGALFNHPKFIGKIGLFPVGFISRRVHTVGLHIGAVFISSIENVNNEPNFRVMLGDQKIAKGRSPTEVWEKIFVELTGAESAPKIQGSALFGLVDPTARQVLATVKENKIGNASQKSFWDMEGRTMGRSGRGRGKDIEWELPAPPRDGFSPFSSNCAQQRTSQFFTFITIN
jgi:hypothetical protein